MKNWGEGGKKLSFCEEDEERVLSPAGRKMDKEIAPKNTERETSLSRGGRPRGAKGDRLSDY